MMLHTVTNFGGSTLFVVDLLYKQTNSFALRYINVLNNNNNNNNRFTDLRINTYTDNTILRLKTQDKSTLIEASFSSQLSQS